MSSHASRVWITSGGRARGRGDLVANTSRWGVPKQVVVVVEPALPTATTSGRLQQLGSGLDPAGGIAGAPWWALPLSEHGGLLGGGGRPARRPGRCRHRRCSMPAVRAPPLEGGPPARRPRAGGSGCRSSGASPSPSGLDGEGRRSDGGAAGVLALAAARNAGRLAVGRPRRRQISAVVAWHRGVADRHDAERRSSAAEQRRSTGAGFRPRLGLEQGVGPADDAPGGMSATEGA